VCETWKDNDASETKKKHKKTEWKKRKGKTEEKWITNLDQCNTMCVGHGRMRRNLPRTLIQRLTTLERCHR
jgi:hypothetical protein